MARTGQVELGVRGVAMNRKHVSIVSLFAALVVSLLVAGVLA